MTSDVTSTTVDTSIFAQFLADRRAKHGDLRMEADPAPTGAAPAADAAPAGDAGTPAPTDAAPAGPPDLNSLGLSAEQQAAINALIGKRVGETRTAERSAAKQALADAQALAGKSETEAAQMRAEQAQAAAKALTARLVAAEAKATLAAHGVQAEHYDAVVKLADLPAADDTGDVDPDAVGKAITDTLAKFPMFKPQPVTEAPAPGTPRVPNPGAGVTERGTETGKPANLGQAIAALYTGAKR